MSQLEIMQAVVAAAAAALIAGTIYSAYRLRGLRRRVAELDLAPPAE